MKVSVLIALSAICSIRALAQSIHEPQNIPTTWSQTYPPFRIVGNVYYVGTHDLACYLVVTPKGNILINTGLAASTALLRGNIETLGFKFGDTKILTTTQAHYDHVGAMAEIKQLTGAKVMVDDKDAGVLADGGSSDYALGKNGRTYAPVAVDRLLQNGDTITLDNTRIIMLHHPGHTKGSCSFLLDVQKDQHVTYRILIANLPTIVTDEKLSAVPSYPGLVKDYAYTFEALKKLSFDIWLSSHAGQFGLHSKHKPGDPYNPEAFIDRKGFDKAVGDLEVEYRKRLE